MIQRDWSQSKVVVGGGLHHNEALNRLIDYLFAEFFDSLLGKGLTLKEGLDLFVEAGNITVIQTFVSHFNYLLLIITIRRLV